MNVDRQAAQAERPLDRGEASAAAATAGPGAGRERGAGRRGGQSRRPTRRAQPRPDQPPGPQPPATILDLDESAPVAYSVDDLKHMDAIGMIDVKLLDPRVRTLRDHLTASTEMLNALADPARQDLVQVLARGELNAGQIAARFSLSRPAVSHHLGILRRAGLVQTRKQGRAVYYRLNKGRIVDTLQALLECLTCC